MSTCEGKFREHLGNVTRSMEKAWENTNDFHMPRRVPPNVIYTVTMNRKWCSKFLFYWHNASSYLLVPHPPQSAFNAKFIETNENTLTWCLHCIRFCQASTAEESGRRRVGPCWSHSSHWPAWADSTAALRDEGWTPAPGKLKELERLWRECAKSHVSMMIPIAQNFIQLQNRSSIEKFKV